MIKTKIESVPLKSQRYRTLGDYFIKKGIRYFKITKTKNNLFDDLIFVHEFCEEILTRNKGIKEKEITKHDLWIEDEIAEGRYPDDAEPGEHPKSPYRREHLLAMRIEKMLAKELGINWEEYNNYLNKTMR